MSSLLVLLACKIQIMLSCCKKKLTNRYEKYDFIHFSIMAKSTTQGRETQNRNVQRIRRENAQITTINKTIRIIRQETTAQKTARDMLGLFYFKGKNIPVDEKWLAKYDILSIIYICILILLGYFIPNMMCIPLA